MIKITYLIPLLLFGKQCFPQNNRCVSKCDLIEILLFDEYTKSILGLDKNLSKSDKSFKAVRIHDEKNFFNCPFLNYKYEPIKVSVNSHLEYSFNTGRYREILFFQRDSNTEKRKVFEFYLYEYECTNTIKNIFSLSYEVDCCENNQFVIKSKSIGEVDF